MIPVVLAYQFLFLWAYSKAPNFLLIWFVTTGLTNILSFVLGYFLYQESLIIWNWLGIAFVLVGIILLNIK